MKLKRQQDGYWTIQEVSARCGMSYAGFYRCIKSGLVPPPTHVWDGHIYGRDTRFDKRKYYVTYEVDEMVNQLNGDHVIHCPHCGCKFKEVG